MRGGVAGVSPDALPIVVQSAQMQQLKGKLADLQQQKVQLSAKYGEKHPAILNVNAQLTDTQRQLDLETSKALQSIKNDYDTAVLNERTLAQNLEAAKADAQDLSRKSVGYNVMEREAKSNRQVYESLLQHEKELRVSSNSRANNVRIVDRAEVPKTPLAPTGRRTWFTSLAIGFVVAIAVAFGLDYMNDTIKTPEDVTRRLKLPFLGLVPSVRGDKHPVLASSHVPHDFGEAFRSLRTSLISRFPDSGTKILAVTSAQPLEGKTTTACNIAMALAYGGSRVLLIDADMRRPGLHRPLRLTNERGLSQVLIGQARVRDVIQRTVDPNLLAITAGRTPPNPSELLASERMKTLISNLSHGPFDWIVVDTPPVLAVTDAVILAPLVSGVAFVVGAEMTRRRLAERALETIMAAPPKSAAIVLNRVDFARNKYYYSRYYGHQYKNYYAEAAV
jgi:capsular exopolysaccharide synthesis family protein